MCKHHLHRGGRVAALNDVLLGLEKLSLLCEPQKDGLDAAQMYQKSRQNGLRGMGTKHGEAAP